MRKDALKSTYASSISGVSSALLAYLEPGSSLAAASASGDGDGGDTLRSPDSSLSREHFHPEVDFLHEFLTANWMNSR